MRSKPIFRKDVTDHQHFQAISRLVREQLGEVSIRSKRIIYVKAILLPFLYLLFYLLAIRYREIPGIVIMSYSLMGIVGVFIFLNLIHEATHGILFPKRNWNRIYLYLFDLIGLNSYIWIQRHNRLHHNFPNLIGWDGDIEQSGPIQVYPHVKSGTPNKYQHLYIFILYPLYLFNWIYIRDFKDFFQKHRIVSTLISIPKIEYLKLFLFKAIYISYMILLPLQLGMHTWLVILGAFCETVAGSFFALLVLLPPHANIGNQFPVPQDGNELDTSWFRHQLITTNDVSVNNWWTRNCMANFNYHVAHHLFPSISYMQAPELTAILRKYADEHGLPYKTNTFWQSIYKHYLLVKQNAIRASAIFSEDL